MVRLFFLLILLSSITVYSQKLPDGFCYLNSVDSSIQVELRYFSSNNFIGKPIKGYKSNKIIVTKKTALALKKVQTILKNFGLSLKIFDAYRPQQAVNHFVKWAKNLNDTIKKSSYYPGIKKKDLFKLEYIASKSGHTRGSTVDITLVDITTGKELDMGSSYDFFGVQSHPKYPKLNQQQRINRFLLRNIMITNGFKPYENEWWHFSLKNEPFPKTYFNFPVE